MRVRGFWPFRISNSQTLSHLHYNRHDPLQRLGDPGPVANSPRALATVVYRL